MTHPDFVEIIAALEPFAELRLNRFMSDYLKYDYRIDAAYIRRANEALPKLRALAETWEAKDARIAELEAMIDALQSSDAYQEARAMWHVGGVLTEAGEEHLAQSFAWKDARIAELEQADINWAETASRQSEKIDVLRIENEKLRAALEEAQEREVNDHNR